MAIWPACALLMGCTAFAAESQLWGGGGERWTTQGRLPDFSYAGYHCGEQPIPQVPPGVSVKTFGAKGDGITDDTAAFLKAVASVKRGAIEIPPGRYKITGIIEINKPGLVLRGADPTKSIIYCPVPLERIRSNMGENASGRATSNYSWSGGMFWVQGEIGNRTLAQVTAESRRGDEVIQVSSTAGIVPGQWVQICQEDPADHSLMTYLYSGEAGKLSKIKDGTDVTFTTRVAAVLPGALRLERPLRFDLRPAWQPEVTSFQPEVTETGIENLGFEFPPTDYKGHFNELGYNAVALSGTVNCWVRNLRIVNADSGLFIRGYFCTADNIVYASRRKGDASGCIGHHGVYLNGEDNLFTHFDFGAPFIHDITVGRACGCVCAAGKGVDLSLDHHKKAPYENLFTDIDLGAGTRPWKSGGGDDLGKHSGARETFWNLRARKPIPYPPAEFGPASMNLIGVFTDQPSTTNLSGKWLEAIPPGQLQPANLYQAQLRRRLEMKSPAR